MDLADVINSLLLDMKTFICLLTPSQGRLSSLLDPSLAMHAGCGGHRNWEQLLEESLCSSGRALGCHTSLEEEKLIRG